MPQAVQNPLLVQSQPSYSTQRSSQSQWSDGPSFQDTLKDAQTRDSQPAESNHSEKAQTSSSKPSTTGKASKKEPAKKSQSTARKSSAKADQADRKADSKEAEDAGEQAGSHDQQAPDANDQEDAKPDKKKIGDAQTVAAASQDTVQLQNPAVAAGNSQNAQKLPAQAAKPAADQTSVNKAGTTTTKPQAKAVKRAQDDSTDPAEAEEHASLPDDDSSAADAADGSAQPAVEGKRGRSGKPALAIQPRKAAEAQGDPSDAATADQNSAVNMPTMAAAVASDAAVSDSAAAPSGPRAVSHSPDDSLLKAAASTSALTAGSAKTSDARIFAVDDSDPADATTSAPESEFADANHAKIVSGIHGQLLPNGGSMQIRLDPPELGSLNVRVEMKDGVMTASFETTNDHATRLLSHSLSDLKTALESQGVSVDKLQVRQSPKDQQSSSEDRQQPQQGQDSARQQEQQRKEMVRRMWQKLMKGSDPLDLVA